MAPSSTIVLYDLAACDPRHRPWSPMTFKVRLALNIKRLEYRTEWVEFPDIAALYKRLRIPPSPADATGGRGPHTLPVIFDPSTGAVRRDSADIIAYLDTTYPHTHRLFPDGTAALQAAFDGVLWTALLAPLLHIVIGRVCAILSPQSAEYFRHTREKAFGRRLEEIGAEADWEAVERGLGQIRTYMESNGGGKDLLMMGTTITYSDVYIASIFRWVKMIVGEDSEDWRRLMALHKRKWRKFLAQFVQYGFDD